MSHRLYALVTRSAALLILALLVAPLWDSWRYRGLAASGGAAFPVGAIMSAPRRAMETTATQAITAAARPVTTDGPARAESPAAPNSPIHAWTPPSVETDLPSAQSVGSAFDAWSARAQVDPFWNGEAAAPPTAGRLPAGRSANEADATAPEMLERAEPDRRDDSLAGGGSGPGTAPTPEKRRAAADGADPDDDESAQEPDHVDDTMRPGETGVVAGLWPIFPAEPETEPMPLPDPADSGPANPSRVYTPHPSSGDPKPVPAPVPLVSARVATPELAPGEMLLVAIRIEHADRMTSLPFHVVFDPAVIEFAGSQIGSALTNHDPVLLASVSPNRPGDLAVGLSLIESAGAFTGTGDVVTLQFRALAPGHSDLSFSRATLRGARSEPVEVHFASGSVTVR